MTHLAAVPSSPGVKPAVSIDSTRDNSLGSKDSKDCQNLSLLLVLCVVVHGRSELEWSVSLILSKNETSACQISVNCDFFFGYFSEGHCAIDVNAHMCSSFLEFNVQAQWKWMFMCACSRPSSWGWRVLSQHRKFFLRTCNIITNYWLSILTVFPIR